MPAGGYVEEMNGSAALDYESMTKEELIAKLKQVRIPSKNQASIGSLSGILIQCTSRNGKQVQSSLACTT